jgi:predicted acetylornithine/succinylornithine family transaminase
MNTLIERERRAVMQTYGRIPIEFVSGEGSWLIDDSGRAYLDCLTGLAVVSVGHANPYVADAVDRQMRTLGHVSNLYYTEPMVTLAENLRRLSGLDQIFFANCGATANEAAIKLARRWGQSQRGEQCYEIVSLDGSFHGRTLATLAATGQPGKQAVFQPLPAGFTQVPVGDLAAMEAAVGVETAAVMVETTQGEGGVIPLDLDYLQALRQLCDERNVLLVVDDVQAGMGRTGTWFSWQQLGFEPDVASVAKALANGLPIGAVMARQDVATAFRPGDHATTFGGGPVVCAAANAVIGFMESAGVLANVEERHDQFVEGLSALGAVESIRGRGLLLAAVLTDDRAAAVADRALDQGLVVNAVRPNAVRFAPPLTISEKEVALALERFAASLEGEV